MKLFCLFISSLLLVLSTCFAVLDSSKQWLAFIDQSAFLLKGGGKWKADNPAYKKSDDWSIAYYGYEFEKGILASTLKLKITGYIPGQSMKVIFWDGFYYWDYYKDRLAYISINFNGIVANGSSDSIGPTSLALILDLTDKKGIQERHRDIQTLHEDQIQSVSYKWDRGKWVKHNEMTWKRE